MSINFVPLASGALGLILALAWNDAVNKTLQSFFPPNGRAAARATLVYALVVTLLVIFVVAVINHTRRLVHKYNCRAAGPSKSSGGSAGGLERAPSGAALSRAPPFGEGRGPLAGPAGSKSDCRACMRRCAPLASVVRLWEPEDG
jgi:hypothetical protein